MKTKETTVNTAEITLDVPIQRGETSIEKLTLHKPNAGALRGVSVRAVLDMDVDTIIKVVPRVSDPKITDQEAARLDLADLAQAGLVLSSFFMPRAVLQEVESQNSSLTM